MVEKFGTTRAGELVEKISIGSNDLSVSLLTLGAIVQDVRLAGVSHSLTLGSNDLAAYEGPMNFFGALVGPVANRIANAAAPINGVVYKFEANENNVTTLHGGNTGTHSRIWTLSEHGPDHASFSLSLPDDLGGFPGKRDISVLYEVTGNALQMTVTGNTGTPTLFNMANHSYWNLDGQPTTVSHTLEVRADRYTPVDSRLIPTGIADVSGTPFDYQKARTIGWSSDDRIDHNLCLTGGKTTLRQIAKLTGSSGLTLTLESTEPGLQIYDAENVETVGFPGLSGKPYEAYCGIALEPQSWPDGPNNPEFPDIELSPTETYKQVTRWVFAAQ